MTGFIQRLVSRGTGKHLQAKQVTLQPRPRSRFEPGTGSKIIDSGVPSEGEVPEETVGSEIAQYSNSPTSTTKNSPPDSKTFTSINSPEKPSALAKMPVSTAPDKSIESATRTESCPSLEKSPDKKINAIELDSSKNTTKQTQEKKWIAQTVPQKSPDFNPAQEQKPEVHEPTRKVPENPVANLFKVIKEHNSRVTAPTNKKTESSLEDIPADRNKTELENSSSHKPSQESLNENQALLPEETQQELENSEEKTTSSGITISIGQIQVEFIQPETGMLQQPKPTIHRTQGFDGYSRARRGNPRR